MSIGGVNGTQKLLLKDWGQTKDVNFCFFDLAETVDCVVHSELIQILETQWLNDCGDRILRYLCRQQVVSVSVISGLKK